MLKNFNLRHYQNLHYQKRLSILEFLTLASRRHPQHPYSFVKDYGRSESTEEFVMEIDRERLL